MKAKDTKKTQTTGAKKPAKMSKEELAKVNAGRGIAGPGPSDDDRAHLLPGYIPRWDDQVQ